MSVIQTNSKGNKIGPRKWETPEDDDRKRLICPDCNYIAYENPKIVVGTVCRYKDKILLCKRAIDPRKGYWTIPAGYMELGESTQEGTKREAWEEAGVRVKTGALLAIYNLPRIYQVQIFYKGTIDNKSLDAGPESLEARLYEWKDIPWEYLAFPTVRLALEYERETWDTLAPVPDQQVITTDLPSAA